MGSLWEVCGKLLFCAISCINFYSSCVLLGVSGTECILVMLCLNAATLCSMGWFERNLIVLFGGSRFAVFVDFKV